MLTSDPLAGRRFDRFGHYPPGFANYPCGSVCFFQQAALLLLEPVRPPPLTPGQYGRQLVQPLAYVIVVRYLNRSESVYLLPVVDRPIGYAYLPGGQARTVQGGFEPRHFLVQYIGEGALALLGDRRLRKWYAAGFTPQHTADHPAHTLAVTGLLRPGPLRLGIEQVRHGPVPADGYRLYLLQRQPLR